MAIFKEIGLDLSSLTKCCRLRRASEDCKGGTRQKAGLVYRLLFIEWCGVVNLSLAAFCNDVKA